MEREALLGLLVTVLGGAALQLGAPWSGVGREAGQAVQAVQAVQLERQHWARLWGPLFPPLVVAAWLCGWALSEPDPVPDRVGQGLLVLAAPVCALLLRALWRAAASLRRAPGDGDIACVGLLRPRIVFDPRLAAALDEPAWRAACDHERAHQRHRDPLRIWLGQLACDLQWPWPSAQQRFAAWLGALEMARDDEARAQGVAGTDLAAAVLASLRLQQPAAEPASAALTGAPSALQRRVERLLGPLEPTDAPRRTRAWLLLPLLLLALEAGFLLGEPVIRPLLALTA